MPMPVLEQFRNFIRHGKAAGGGAVRASDPAYTTNPGARVYDARTGQAAEPVVTGSNVEWDPTARESSLDFVDLGTGAAYPGNMDTHYPDSTFMAPDVSTMAIHGSRGTSHDSHPNEKTFAPSIQSPDDGMGAIASPFVSTPTEQTQRKERNRDVAEQLVQREIEEKKKRAALPEYEGLTDRYVLLDKMGDGAFSNVYKAAHRQTGLQCAIKVVRKYELDHTRSDRLNPQFRKKNKATERANILKEVQIMRGLDHDNIIRLLEFSESPDYYFLVLELAQGGELFHQIAKLTYFSEDLARHVIVQVAEAIRYMHEEAGVVHRDIKPENILYDPVPYIPSKHPIERPYDEDKVDEGEFIPGVGGGGIGKVKIADFGLSKVLWEASTKTPCGTAGYTAPEIVKDQRYDRSVDMWALGCVLYTILCGFPPFYDESIQVLTEKVARGQYTFLSPWWDDISASSKDLISHLLTVDPRKRYTIDQFLAHPWIQAGRQPKPAQPVPSVQATTVPTGVPIAATQTQHLQPPSREAPLDSPLLDALRGDTAATRHARAGMGLTTPGVHQLREAFDVSYAVHRMEEEAYHRNAFAANQRAQPDLMQLNEEDEEDETQKLPPGVAEVLAQRQARQANQASRSPQVQAQRKAATPAAAPSAPRTGGFELNMNNATLLRNRGNRGRKLHQNHLLNPASAASPIPSPVT